METGSFLARALASLLVCAAGACLAAGAAKAPKKVVVHTTLTGKDLSRSTALVGDVPEHELMQRLYSYRVSSDDEDFDGFRTENFAQTDSVAGKGTHHGYGVWTNAAGEKIYVHFEGEHHPVAGGNAEFSGKAEMRGGTGKFAHIGGSGTYHGTITPTGQTSEAEFDVTY